MNPRYEEDFYAWSINEAHLLREGRFSELDIENIIEEIESMGRSQKSQLVSRLAQLIFHLLKWQFQPDFRGRSWEGSIIEQRKRIKNIMRDNSSLKSKLDEAIIDAYDISLSLIKKETPIDLKLLPADCPYSFEESISDEFYPE